MFRKMLVVVAAVTWAIPAAAADDCEARCKVDQDECIKVCKQYAGKGASHCSGGCKKLEQDCTKKCKEDKKKK